jgi:hypothetical protein
MVTALSPNPSPKREGSQNAGNALTPSLLWERGVRE